MSSRLSPRRQTLAQIFTIPAVLGLLSAVGLVSALVGDGIWDGLSWAALAVPVVLCGLFILWPRRR